MKKVLGLLLLSSSIFSMQVALVKDNCLKVKAIQHKLIKQQPSKSPLSLKDIKQRSPKLTIDVKDCINPSSFSAPKGLGDIKLFHNEKGFHVLQNNNMHLIKSWNTDKLVRKATTLDIKDFQKKGYFYVTQMGDKEFEIKALERVKGGGILGAMIGATVGKVGVSVLGHGAIFLIGGLTGPAAPYTIFALESYFGAAIEVASIKGAVTLGLIGAVASGPV